MFAKKIALPVALLLTAAASFAYADSSEITLYGRINVDGERVKLDAPVSSQKTRLSSNSSNLGIRGSEKLGGNLKAWFQVEQDLRIDGDNQPAGWATRNSAVGLSGDFGSILAGRWDTPYKTLVLRLDPFGDMGIPSMSNLMGQAAFKTGLTQDFQQRPINAIQYWSPNFSGFTGRAHVSTNEGTGNFRRNYSASAQYENGPFFGGLAYEKHIDSLRLGGASNLGDDKGLRVALGYQVPTANTKLGIVYEKLTYESARSGDLKRDGIWFSVDQPIAGNQAIWLTYGKAKSFEGSGTVTTPVLANNTRPVRDNSGAKMLSLAYDYKFSKRTDAYVFYTKIDNETNAFYDFGNISYGGVPKGGDLSGFGLGLIHRF
ncbi:MAG: porin [Burkholderiales bacterium]